MCFSQTLREHDLNLTTEKRQAYDIAVAGGDILANWFFEPDVDKPDLKEWVSQGIEDPFKQAEVHRDIMRVHGPLRCLTHQSQWP